MTFMVTDCFIKVYNAFSQSSHASVHITTKALIQ